MALYTLQEEPESPLDPPNNPCHNPFHEICHDSLNESKRCIYDPVNLQSNDPLIKDPINSSLPSPAYLDKEDDEFTDDMALHEPPVLKPPPNSPNSQSMQESPNSSKNLAPHATMEEDDYVDSDEFEDSVDILSMTLHSSLAECEKAMALFFNNRLDDAVAVMTPWKETSLYHAHGAAIFEFIPAVLTLEPEQIQRAQDAVRHTFTLCGQLRRMYTFTQSIGAIIKKPNYGGYTEEEAHAELVNAEALLLLACLGIIENEDMTGFLKASLRVKSSYNAYRMCAKILERKSWEDETSRAHFESGVRLGLATFNVMIAMLPPRIVTLLEFVGFSADKKSGESELLKAAESTGLRSVLCELTLLVYYLIIGHFAAIQPDFAAADKIISKSLKKYPNSVWFLMFKARSQLLRGKIVDSIITYQKTCKTKNLWPQMKHLAYWELVWAFAMLRQWTKAAEYASLLEHDSKWSRTIYMYAQAAMLIENQPQTPVELMYVDGLLRNAGCYRQRLLGRSLPMEKFVARRCERWSRRGCLVLPGVEWLYLWNIFPSLAADRDHADAILKIIERTKDKIIKSLEEKEDKESTKKTIKKNKTDKLREDYDHDDLALAEFLQGSLLSAMALPRLALQNLETVIEMKDNIKEHTFLLPYATVEIASCYYQFGDPKRAVEILQDARKKYSGYLLEARLQFRIHSKLEYIHAGVNFVRKPYEASSALDVQKARQTSNEAGPSRSTTGVAGPSCSANTPRITISEIHAGLELHSRVKVSKPSTVSTAPRAGPSSVVDTDTDWLSIENPVAGPSSRADVLNPSSSLSVSGEPMPSTSSYLGPRGSAQVNINVVVEENVCETESTASTLESFDSATSEPRAGKSDMPEAGSATSDMPERFSANSDMREQSSANSDMPEWPSTNSDMLERPSANSDMPEWPSANSDMPEWPSINSDKTERPSANSVIPEWPSANSDMPERPSTNSDMPERSSGNSNMPKRPSANSDMPEWPSANSDMPERPSTNSEMPELRSVRCDVPKHHPAKNVMFEMDVLAAAGAEPTATGSAAPATAEVTKKQKWLR